MAVVRNLCYRKNCSGKLGDMLVAYMNRGVQCVRAYVIPHDPKTPLQRAQRNVCKPAIDAYYRFTEHRSTSGSYDEFRKLARLRMTGFNVAMRSFFRVAKLTPQPLMCIRGRVNAPFQLTIEVRAPDAYVPQIETGTWSIMYSPTLVGPYIVQQHTQTSPGFITATDFDGIPQDCYAAVHKDGLWRSCIMHLDTNPL